MLRRFWAPIWLQGRIGRKVQNPEELPRGCKVVVFEKESDNWWEHGWICIHNGKKAINCMDGIYELDEVEVYLDINYR